jgi:hypothetical protein
MRSAAYLDRAPIDAAPGQLPRIRAEQVAKAEFECPALTEQGSIAARSSSECEQAKTLREHLTRKLSGTALREACSRGMETTARQRPEGKTAQDGMEP